jgi:hypothetical protein
MKLEKGHRYLVKEEWECHPRNASDYAPHVILVAEVSPSGEWFCDSFNQWEKVTDIVVIEKLTDKR